MEYLTDEAWWLIGYCRYSPIVWRGGDDACWYLPGSPHVPPNKPRPLSSSALSGERRGRDIAIRTCAISSFLFGLTHSSIVLLFLVVYIFQLIHSSPPSLLINYFILSLITKYTFKPLTRPYLHFKRYISSINMPSYIVRPPPSYPSIPLTQLTPPLSGYPQVRRH